MDWKLIFSTFGAVFLAELGDKTQLATFSLAAGSSSRLSVFIGAACALVATSALGVLVGGALHRFIPAIWIRRAAGAIFIIMGILFLISKGEQTPEKSAAVPSATPSSAASPKT